MPIFEMECPHCHSEKEVLCKYQDLTEVCCEICDTLMLRKISVPASPAFKGTGYYCSDFKGK